MAAPNEEAGALRPYPRRSVCKWHGSLSPTARTMLKVYLTFDVEDFINPRSIGALRRILKLLSKHDVQALFFITAHFADVMKGDVSFASSFDNHLVGYHSSGHSVHPIVHEFTDLEKYEDAVRISYVREGSAIDPLTGQVKGRGGIDSLKDVFPRHKIDSFRAPGYAWSPPHLEALRSLAIRFDFSAALSTEPVIYKGITFYPFQAPRELLWKVPYMVYTLLFKEVLVFNWHPDEFVNAEPFDTIYYSGNPRCLRRVRALSAPEIDRRFEDFEHFLRKIACLKKLKLITVCPSLSTATQELRESVRLREVYERACHWTKTLFGYQPVFLYSHLQHFFADAT